jgi:hypothetical protein
LERTRAATLRGLAARATIAPFGPCRPASSAFPRFAMQILPIDLTALIGTILGISIVLIPVAGLTVRFALKPAVATLTRFFDHQGLEESVRVLERRIDFQEHQIESLEGTIRRITEGNEFDRKLLESRERSPSTGASTDPTG